MSKHEKDIEETVQEKWYYSLGLDKQVQILNKHGIYSFLISDAQLNEIYDFEVNKTSTKKAN